MRRAVNLIVIQKKRILLVRKGEVWILPGGKPEKDECDSECLKREMREELPRLKYFVNSYYGTFIGKTPHKKDYLEAAVYIGGLENNLMESSAEITDARFVDNFKKYNISDITKKIINSLIERGYLNNDKNLNRKL